MEMGVRRRPRRNVVDEAESWQVMGTMWGSGGGAGLQSRVGLVVFVAGRKV
jgi:hypothetical protein